MEEFISCKSFRAKGKRVTTFEVGSISFVEPLEKEINTEIDENVNDDADFMELLPEEPSGTDDVENNMTAPTLF